MGDWENSSSKLSGGERELALRNCGDPISTMAGRGSMLPVTPTRQGSTNIIVVQAGPDIKARSYFRNNQSKKMLGDMAQVVKRLTRKQEALSPTPQKC